MANLKRLLCSGLALTLATPVSAFADSYAVTHLFGLQPTGGIFPDTATVDDKGRVFVQTAFGGKRDQGQGGCDESARPKTNGCGTLTELRPSGKTLQLWTFYSLSSGNLSRLIAYKNHLFGTALEVGSDGKSAGLGIVFSLAQASGELQVIHTFQNGAGIYPDGLLAVNTSGKLYGLTEALLSGRNQGLLYSLAKDGTYSELHNFTTTQTDYGVSIALDSAGNVFGTDYQGDPDNKCGSLFRYQPKTATFNTIFSFADGTHGCNPFLTGIDASGNLFGYTAHDRLNNPGGTLFELINGGDTYTYRLLYTFRKSDGYTPAGLTLLADDSLIGVVASPTQNSGGIYGTGALFRYSSGTLTVLHSFIDPAGGTYPSTAPTMTASGQIIGTTGLGGDLKCAQAAGPPGCGVLYAYTP